MYYYHAATRQRVVMNFEAEIGSVPVPSHWTDEYLGRTETVGRYILRSEANQVGYQSVMIPGFVSGCWNAYKRYGSGNLSWAELLSSAIRIAKEGFAVYPFESIGGGTRVGRPGYPSLMDKMNATRDMQRTHLRQDGTPYESGDWLIQSDYARTLERLAEAGGDDFYTGEIGRIIADDFAKNNGFISKDDLGNYAVVDQVPLVGRFRGLEVTATNIASSGPPFIEMLKILDQLGEHGFDHNSPAYIDLFARIQRASLSDNTHLKGFGFTGAERLIEEMIGDERAAYWARRIASEDRIVVQGGAVNPGTTHLTAVDQDRNIVTFMHSIGSLAGSGVVTPGLGFIYNNFLGHYNPLAGHHDSIVPGKRFGGGVPAIVFKNDEPYIAIGAPGGSRLITSSAQTIVNVVDFGMDLETAVSLPRFHSEAEQQVFLEPAFTQEIEDVLLAKGNEVQRSMYMSCVNAIRILDSGELEAGADPRGGAGIGQHP